MAEVQKLEIDGVTYNIKDSTARSSAATNATNINRNAADIAIQKARIDQIASLPSGSTTGDAELLDIRVKADGTSASSAGNAVREQITEIKNQLSISSKGVLTTGTDLNTIKENGLWTLPNRTFPNKPSDFVAGVLMCYHGVVSGDYSQYFVQTLVETGNSANYNKIYTRIFAEGVGWGSWAVLAKTDDPATFHRFETFNPDSTAVNLNSFVYGTTLILNVNSHPVLNAPNGFTAGILLAFKPHSEYNYIIQILYDTTRGSNTPLFFIRASEGGNWTPWHRILDYTEIQTMIQNASGKMFWKYRLLGIFHTIGVVGDSLASGQGRINDYTHYYDFYDYSWPQCMKRILNNEVYNFTKSGLTTRTWLTDSKGYSLASDGNHKCQCYIIGLGVNDAATLGSQYLGSSSDIDLNDYHNNGDTYYGNYAKIIQMLKEIEPRAVIFTIENPSNNSSLPISSFNQAVSYMETVFDNVYNVRLDSSLYNSASEFINKNLVSGHYTPAAYQFMAEYLTNTISDIIYNNPEDFYFVNLIGTEYNTPS